MGTGVYIALFVIYRWLALRVRANQIALSIMVMIKIILSVFNANKTIRELTAKTVTLVIYSLTPRALRISGIASQLLIKHNANHAILTIIQEAYAIIVHQITNSIRQAIRATSITITFVLQLEDII